MNNDKFTINSYEIDSQNLKVKTIGSGQHFFIIHGWLNSYNTWEHIASALSDRYEVHLINLPGFASSEFKGEKENIITKYYELVSKYINQVTTGDNYILLGHSLGGIIVNEMIANNKIVEPEKVIYVCSPIDGISWIRDTLLINQENITNEFFKYVHKFRLVFIVKFLSLFVFKKLKYVEKHIIDDVLSCDHKVASVLIYEIARYESAFYRDFKNSSILFLESKYDKFVSKKAYADVQSINKATYYKFEESVHMPMFEVKEEFLQIVNRFLDNPNIK